MKRFITIVLLALVTAELNAQCCSGGVPMSGNLGMPLTDVGTFQLNLSYDLNNLKTLKQGSKKLDDDYRQRLTHSVLLEFGYSINERISVDGFFSFVRQERRIQNPGSRANFTKSEGIGDAVLLIKYKILEGFALGYGVKAPFGSSDELREDGVPLGADLQPGSGSWDQIFYASYSKGLNSRPSLSVFGTSIFRMTGKNNSYLGSSTYEFGDEFQLIVGASDRIVISKFLMDPSLRFRFRNVGRDQFDFNGTPGSGGTFIFINPGLSWQLGQNIAYQANVELPLYAKVNEAQLAPTFRINTGIQIRIRRKDDFQFQP